MSTGLNLSVERADLLASGTITTAGGSTDRNSYVSISSGGGASTWVADIRGMYSSATILVFETTINGIDWHPAAGFQWGTTSPVLTTSCTGPDAVAFMGSISAFQQFRVRATAIGSGDTVTVTLRLGAGSPSTNLPSLPIYPRLESTSVSLSGSGDNTLVAGISGQTIRVFKLFLVFASSTGAVFKDGVGGTAFDGNLSMNAGGAIVLDLDEEPWFLTSAGNDFVLNLGSSSVVGGRVYFTQS